MKGEILSNLQEKYMRATLTRKEVATELGLSLRTIDNMIKDGGVLPQPLRLGEGKKPTVRFRLIDIANFIADEFEKMEYLESVAKEGNDKEEQK